MCAQPDHHLVVEGEVVRVPRGAHENLHRPSVDVLFLSATANHDGPTCGIILSGALDDGTSGTRAIAATGGMTIVQDPDDALVPSMPQHVLEAIEPDHILTADEIGRRLPDMLRQPGRAPVRRLNDALWTAVRALEEQETLTRRMLDRSWARGTEATRQRLEERVEAAHRRSDVLRQLLLQPMGPVEEGFDPSLVGAHAGEDLAAG